MSQINCFSFSPYGGIEEGIRVKEGVIGLNGKVLPRHVAVGGMFVQVDRVKTPMTFSISGEKRVFAASARKIVTDKDTFHTIASEGSDGILLHVRTSVNNPRVHEKQVVGVLNAWVGIITDDDVVNIIYDRGEGLFLLTEEGQEVDVYLASGAVTRLVREKGRIMSVPLDWRAMAAIRVDQLNNQLMAQADNDEGRRRAHGILAAAVRLVRHTAKIPEVREIFSGFLADNVGRLTERMRDQIRVILANVGDRHAGMFLSGFDGHNILSIDQDVQKASKTPARAEAERKRRERIEKDRLAREQMRGPSNGGGKKK